MRESYLIVGGAGFIGSSFVDALLAEDRTERITVYDNFSSGREWHLQSHRHDPRLVVIRGDVEDLPSLTRAASDHDVAIHLASNPDIARAMSDPKVDFDQGTLLTHNVVEAVRVCGIARLAYASGSGVYGDLGETVANEDYGPLVPISTYGASKLAGEAMICAYAHMFDFRACAFRFGNVVGRRQTHGVGFDFVRRLLERPTSLRILGDGTQSKSYVDVDDVVRAVLLAVSRMTQPFQVYNVATGDYITVREIADLAVQIVGQVDETAYKFTGGPRGWKGDVPIVRLDTSRIRALGWDNRLNSREAMTQAMTGMAPLAEAGAL